MITPSLRQSQAQRVPFVLIDDNCDEVSHLLTTLRVRVSKNGGLFAESAGTIGEIGSGWYYYEFTAAETDTPGPVAVQVTSTRIDIQRQNLAYFVRVPGGDIEFTYTVTNSVTGFPIEGVEVWFATDEDGNNVTWRGTTDTFGVARDSLNQLPLLDAGTYFVWRRHSNFRFQNPDTEQVD